MDELNIAASTQTGKCRGDVNVMIVSAREEMQQKEEMILVKGRSQVLTN
jgi:hypothetical protein